MVLLGKALIALRSKIIIAGFQRDSFSEFGHSTKILFSYLDPMILLVNRRLLPKGTYGMTLWPFVLLRESRLKEDAVLINHERIHLRQQIQMLILPFYLWYGIEFLIRLAILRNKKKAYRALAMEREAYAHESDPNYLKTFRFWAFLRYF